MDWIVTSMRDVNHRYFEAHVTIEPILEEDRIAEVKQWGKYHQFRLAELLMRKRPGETEERSRDDMFFTGRSYSWSDIKTRTRDFVDHLQRGGITVWRYKIECTMIDTMYQVNLLPSEGLPEKYLHPKDPVS